MRFRAFLLSLGLFSSAAVSAPQSSPWVPTSKWNVEYADQRCVASRSFASGGRQLTIGIVPPPANNIAQLWVFAGLDQPLLEQARLKTGGTPITSERMFLRAVSPSKQRIYEASLAADDYSRLLQSGSLRVQAGSLDADLHLSRIADVQKLLDHCNAGLLKEWGFPEDLQKVAKVAVPNRPLASLITGNDFPAEARYADASGTVDYLLTVGMDGRVKNCRILKSSGTPALDAATCAAVTKRARFQTAMNAAGQPVEVPFVNSLTWVLLP